MAGRNFWGLKASGILFQRSSDNNILLLRRSNTENDGAWGIPGGKVDSGESPKMSAMREVEEEVGSLPKGKMSGRSYTFKTELDEDDYISGDSRSENRYAEDGEAFEYITYHYVVDDDEWEPELNWEHDYWGWYEVSSLPKPMLTVKDDKGKTIQPVAEMLSKLVRK